MKKISIKLFFVALCFNAYSNNGEVGSNNGVPEKDNCESECVAPGDPIYRVRRSGGKLGDDGLVRYNYVTSNVNTATNVYSLTCTGTGPNPCVFSYPGGISSSGSLDELDLQRAIEVADEIYNEYFAKRKDNDQKQLIISIPSEDKLRVYQAVLTEIEFGTVEIEVTISRL